MDEKRIAELSSRGVPTRRLEGMTLAQLTEAYEMVRSWDTQALAWGKIWTWDDCPDLLKELHF